MIPSIYVENITKHVAHFSPLQHHYKNYHRGYGVTSKIWDYPFGTVLDVTDANQVHAR
ncbi:unnamed protein product [Debaryomyces tyrocola]|nr:unnamed protein product [Debaryomyces tyrocola]